MDNSKRGCPMQLIASADETSADLHILGDISSWPWDESDTSCANVVDAIAALPDTVADVTVHINSFGGEVAEGIAIYNALKASPAHVTTVCEGFACSIASVIFMAGDERVMRPASLIMVHNPWMSATGNSAELRRAADDLDAMAQLSKTAYLTAAGDSLDAETLDALMDAETWITPEDAVAYGLATSVAAAPEEGEAPTQSCREAVMRALTAPAQAAPDAGAIAEAVAARVIEALDDRESEPAQDAAALARVEQTATADPFAALAAKFKTTE